MTQFHRWAPAAYMNSIAYMRRPAGRLSPVIPWAVAVISSIVLAVVLFIHLAPSSLFSSGNKSPDVPTKASTPSQDTQLLLEEKLERLAKVVDQLSAKVEAISQSRPAVDAVPRELRVPSKTTEVLKHELATERTTHAVVNDLAELQHYVKDVADSIALIDTKISDPAALQKKLDQERALSHQ